MNMRIVYVGLFIGGLLLAQASPIQSQHSAEEKKGQVTVHGCVSRSSGDFILMQSDPGNSYVLETGKKIKLDHYLGQQVEVTGTESPTLSTSSTFRRRAGSSVTITVDSIKTISARCGE